MTTKTRRAAAVIAAVGFSAGMIATAQRPGAPGPLSPIALAAGPGGKSLFVACATGRRFMELDLASRKVVRKVDMPGEPSGVALSPDGTRAYVTCAAAQSVVAVVETASGRVLETIPAGHTATAPVVSPDGRRLYVCNRFHNDVEAIDLEARKELWRSAVEREPAAAAATPDGAWLLVANHLHAGRADAPVVAAGVSVLDASSGKVVRTVRLPNGSGALQGIGVSPDGRYAAVTHVLARYQTPTSQIERGWMNTNAVSVIDVAKLSLAGTVLLDGPFRGAASPWGMAWSGRYLAVAHSGAHEVSVTDFPALIEKLAGGEGKDDVANDLSFLGGLRQTVRLREGDRGPRGVAAAGGVIYAANYFSDSLSAIDPAFPERVPESIPLGPKTRGSLVRKGEEYFHDAGICFQQWQSCAGCHPDDARSDALNWDLLNDGLGNPKNSKSLLLSHRTPPAMSLGIRDTAETAVRSGIRNILFTQQPEEVAAALDAYLKSLKPVASPYLVNGKLSEKAMRGRELFNDPAVGCGNCHPSGLFTDLKAYDVGTGEVGKKFDTPTLVEVWRTAPYLHDGSAGSMREVLRERNGKDRHGRTAGLSRQQIEDLVEYVMSL